jgi:DNA polymerase-3 subunit delta
MQTDIVQQLMRRLADCEAVTLRATPCRLPSPSAARGGTHPLAGKPRPRVHWHGLLRAAPPLPATAAQLNCAQLHQHLQRGLRPLYTLHGDEPLLIQEAADAIRATARAQGYTERTVHTVAGAHFDWSEVLAAGGSLSLFADRQIVRSASPPASPARTAARPAAAGRAGARQRQHAHAGAAARLDKATQQGAWFGALDGNGVTHPGRAGGARRAAAVDRAAPGQQGQRVAPGDEGQRTLQFFADRVEGNLLAAHQEIQKLALLYPPAS